MPKLTRRDFLTWSTGSLAFLASSPGILKAMELQRGGRDFSSPQIVDRVGVPFTDVCGDLHDGGLAFIQEGELMRVEGNPDHVANASSLSPASLALPYSVYHPYRLIKPLKRIGKRGEGRWEVVTWESAISDIASHVYESVVNGRPEQVGFYLGKDHSGGAPKRFMDTIGSPSIIDARYPGTAGLRAALKATWGEETLMPDLGNTDYILNFGANIFETHNAFNKPLADSRTERRAKLVTFDIRLTNTAGRSDEWVALRPGTDGLIALAMAHAIEEEGLVNREFLARWTDLTPAALKEHLSRYAPEKVAAECGITAEKIRRIATEFANARTACLYTYRGVSGNSNGYDSARAVFLLAVITGNIERMGGVCLPRTMNWPQPQPVPATPGQSSRLGSLADAPNRLASGKATLSTLFIYQGNPVHSATGAALWRQTLSDEKKIPMVVDFSPFPSETASMADYILPDCLPYERFDPEASPSAMWPWLGIRQPVIKPLGGMETRMVLQNIIHRTDIHGSLGMSKFWDFTSSEDWLNRQADQIPELKAAGGLTMLKQKGVWPIVGEISRITGKRVDAKGKELKPQYGLHQKSGFRTPSKKIEFLSAASGGFPHWKAPIRTGGGKLVLTGYKCGIHDRSHTADNKWLAEMFHTNHAMINKELAHKLKIKDGQLVRIVSDTGFIVTRARVTHGVSPEVVAIAGGMGHTAFGQVARALRGRTHDTLKGRADRDVDANLWWKDNGVNPNDMIPAVADARGIAPSWTHLMVTVEPARKDDKYGTIMADTAKLLKA